MIGINIIFSGFLWLETLLILAIGGYAWRKKTIPGANALFLLCIASSFYSFGYGMELMSTQIDQVNFWSKFQYIGLPFIPFLCLLLALTYTGEVKRVSSGVLAGLAMPGFTTCVLRLTSEYQPFMYGKMTLVDNGFFPILNFEKGHWYYIHFVYFLVCSGLSIYVYVNAYQKAVGFKKQHILFMMVASALPFVSIYINLNRLFLYQMDSGPFFILLDYLMFTVGIFRYNIMYLIPLSRNNVFEWMEDGVLVLDLQGYVIDMNRSAKALFGVSNEWLTSNKLLEHVLKSEPELAHQINQWYEHMRANVTQPSDRMDSTVLEWQVGKEPIRTYNVRIRALMDQSSGVGVMVMLSEVTKTKALVNQLKEMAQTDHLTGIYNRRHFIELVEGAVKEHLAKQQEAFVVVLDIDHFKKINDQYGHLAGDYVLKTMATWMQKQLREQDVLGRYGGEEFVIFMAKTNQDEGLHRIEQLRRQLEEMVFSYEEENIHLTASFGCSNLKITSRSNIKLFEEMFSAADEALYDAKNSGRNCIRIR